MNAAAIQGADFERSGSMLQLGPMTLPLLYPCADGYVAMVPTGAQIGRFVDWLIADGAVDASWADEQWDTYQTRVMSGQEVGSSNLPGPTNDFSELRDGRRRPRISGHCRATP